MVNEKRSIKGDRKLFLWGIIYVLLTYAYPVLVYITMPRVDGSVNSSAEYEAAAKAQNGVLGSNLPLVFLIIPVVLLIINIVVAMRSKGLDRIELLNVSRLIKYSLIPFYILGGCMILLLFLLIFTPVVIMIFLAPPLIGILSIIGWISMIGSSPFMIAYIRQGIKDGKYGKLFSAAIVITQFFFGADVVGTFICSIIEKGAAKLINNRN